MFDAIIIGAGPAGLTAALYLARKKAEILVLTQKVGGQIMDAPLIENYPGFGKISGFELVAKMREQVEKLGVEIRENAEVQKIVRNGKGFEIEGRGFEKVMAKSVLICSGKRPRKLGVPGEENLLGKGISFCVTCDGPLFTGKDVAVIGGGNSAISAALELERYARKIYILNLGRDLAGDNINIEKIKKSSKIEIVDQAKTTVVFGRTVLESLKYQDLTSGQEKELKVEGIFVEVGWEPSTDYLKGFLEMTPRGEIKIDTKNATSVPGVFAAGDVTDTPFKQIVIAAGDGAKAALSAWEYLIPR